MKNGNEKFIKRVTKLAHKYGITDAFMVIGNDSSDRLSYLRVANERTKNTDVADMVKTVFEFCKKEFNKID